MSGLSAGTTYDWYVTISNLGGTTTSSTYSFTTVALPSISGISPTNGATNYNSTELYWTASNASNWQAYINGSEIASGTMTIGSNVQASTSYNLQSDTSYTYYVVVSNAFGSATSSTSSFTTVPLCAAPTPVSPADNATGVGTSPTLTWDSVEYAVSYVLYSNAPGVGTISGITSTSYTLSGLTSGTQYYWYVEAFNGLAPGGACATQYFTA